MNRPSPSAPTDARRVRTRRRLLKALLHLLERRPFDQITIREIAADADIGYATFFRHYLSKDALLDDLAAGEITDLLDKTLPLLSATDAREACEALFESIAERKRVWRALLTGGAAGILRGQFMQQALKLAANYPTTPKDEFADLSVIVPTSATIEIIAWWLNQPSEPDIRKTAAILDRLAIAPAIAQQPSIDPA